LLPTSNARLIAISISVIAAPDCLIGAATPPPAARLDGSFVHPAVGRAQLAFERTHSRIRFEPRFSLLPASLCCRPKRPRQASPTARICRIRAPEQSWCTRHCRAPGRPSNEVWSWLRLPRGTNCFPVLPACQKACQPRGSTGPAHENCPVSSFWRRPELNTPSPILAFAVRDPPLAMFGPKNLDDLVARITTQGLGVDWRRLHGTGSRRNRYRHETWRIAPQA